MAAITAKEDFLTFNEVSNEADHYDEWLFGSTKRYHHVNMYEIDKSIEAAQWYRDNDKCKGHGSVFLCTMQCLQCTTTIIW